MGEVTAFSRGLVLDGRYRLERPLAEGGMGSIWVGRQIALEREVAVKLLRVGSSAPLRERLRREALALAAVHHPSVVQVFDFGETADGSPYLVMELVRGEPLGARLHRAGPFAATDAAQLLLPLLEGLSVAHRAGVIHRDIKPDNVVLAPGPAGPQPKLLDFGIARIHGGESARLTADGGFLGTPAYMAPEQVKGLVADERADVWGVGAVLYEMLAGRAPFGVEDVMTVIRRVVDEPPSFPRDARGLDGRLWGVIMTALRKEPEQRYPSALAFREGLAAWLESKGITPPSNPAFQAVDTLPATASPDERLASTVEAAAVSVSRRVQPPPLHADGGSTSLDALIRAKLGQS